MQAARAAPMLLSRSSRCPTLRRRHTACLARQTLAIEPRRPKWKPRGAIHVGQPWPAPHHHWRARAAHAAQRHDRHDVQQVRSCSTGSTEEPRPPEGPEQQQETRRIVVAHVVERSLLDIFGNCILPVRHALCVATLHALRLAFPSCWNSQEFWRGAPHAFRFVTDQLDVEEGDDHPLHGLVSDELLQRVHGWRERAAERDREAEEETGEAPPTFHEVVNVRLRGLLSVRLRSGEDGEAVVLVRALFGATEEYRPPKGSSWEASDEEQQVQKFHVKRLHRWTFQRTLSSRTSSSSSAADNPQEPGDWLVTHINKRRWRPPFALSDMRGSSSGAGRRRRSPGSSSAGGQEREEASKSCPAPRSSEEKNEEQVRRSGEKNEEGEGRR